jgi:hypothetical protein
MSRNPWVTGTIFAVMCFSLVELAAGNKPRPRDGQDNKTQDGMNAE